MSGLTWRFGPESIDGAAALALTFQRDVMPLTVNEALRAAGRGRFRSRTELAEWLSWSTELAEEFGQKLRPPVVVVATHLRKDRRSMPDVGAPLLAVKAVIDGVVKAGLLPGDGPAVVTRLTFEAPLVTGAHGLRVAVTETEGATTP